MSVFRCPLVYLLKNTQAIKATCRILIVVGVASAADVADSSGFIVTEKAAFTPHCPPSVLRATRSIFGHVLLRGFDRGKLEKNAHIFFIISTIVRNLSELGF